MKIPKRLRPLVDEGLVDKVVSRLMSGKEADVYVVQCGSVLRCAKVYKEASKRGFKQSVKYQEGRKVRNSRRARAMEKGSKFGRQQREENWQNTEVDALYRLDGAGVRIPKPYDCIDGILLMELITDEDGHVAPRLNDITLSADQARKHHATMMTHIKRMLCAGIIHGDLSEFNVLMAADGPVIIDLPQAVDAAANNNAKVMLARDVKNITEYFGQFSPEILNTQYDSEIWSLYESSKLTPDTPLTGKFEVSTKKADVDMLLNEIQAVISEQEERDQRLRDDNLE